MPAKKQPIKSKAKQEGDKVAKPEGKHAGGAPEKYKPEYAAQAYKLCLLRFTDSDLANFFNVKEQTINNWKKAHPEFFESIRAGKEIADMEIVNELFRGAKDKVVIEQQAIKVKEITYDEDTGRKLKERERVEIVNVERVIPGDFRNQQLWLMNRQGEKWRNKQDVTVDGHIQIQQITGMEVK